MCYWRAKPEPSLVLLNKVNGREKPHDGPPQVVRCRMEPDSSSYLVFLERLIKTEPEESSYLVLLRRLNEGRRPTYSRISKVQPVIVFSSPEKDKASSCSLEKVNAR